MTSGEMWRMERLASLSSAEFEIRVTMSALKTVGRSPRLPPTLLAA
jgi:hypothetical protein